MTSFLRADRSRAVAAWLMVVAGLVVAMVVVGGLTRLTGSGLSITQWKPISGVLPPLNDAQWQAEFSRYRAIPQFQFVNPDMTLAQFRFIYFWEWSHRLLARLVGAVFLLPFVVFALRRAIPRRLWGQLGLLILLLGLEPIVGWGMVASGLSNRVSVAPERLMTHLGIAFALLAALVWTALDAWAGSARQPSLNRWRAGSLALAALIFVQVLLGALVAGNQAGLIYNDWPLFAGRLFPEAYSGGTLWATIAHNQGAVQLHHRLLAYAIVVLAVLMAARAMRARDLPEPSRRLAAAVAALVLGQATLGVLTLVFRAPLGLAVGHQLMAALTLGVAVAFAWRVRRV